MTKYDSNHSNVTGFKIDWMIKISHMLAHWFYHWNFYSDTQVVKFCLASHKKGRQCLGSFVHYCFLWSILIFFKKTLFLLLRFMECPHLEEAVQLLAPPTFADNNTQFVCAGEISQWFVSIIIIIHICIICSLRLVGP